MEREEILKELRKLKPLNMDQISRIRHTAVQDVLDRIGPEPIMEAYLVNIGIRSLLEPLDYLLISFFLSLIVLSVIHIITFGSHLVEASTADIATATTVGIQVSKEVMAWVTQLGLLVMAETGSLGFSVRNAKRHTKLQELSEKPLNIAQKYFHFDFIAAVLCAILAIIYNVHALTYVNYRATGAQDQFFYAMGWVIGILIPILVIYLGEHFAEMFLELDAARQEALELYYVDVHNWREWKQNPDTFDLEDGVNSYRSFFSTRLVEYYKQNIAPRLKAADVEDVIWTPEVERYLAARERVNMRRMDNLDEIEDFFVQGEGQLPSKESDNLPEPSPS